MKHKHIWQYVSSEDIYEPNGRTYTLYGYDQSRYEIPMEDKVATMLKFVCECGKSKKVKENNE